METSKSSLLNSKKIKVMTRIAIMCAIICVFAQISIPLPFSPVPITLQTFAIYICAIFFTPVQAAITAALYVTIGAIGMPVFSSFEGGLGKITGYTGGFIISFIPMAFICSLLIHYTLKQVKNPVIVCAKNTLAFIIGSVINYAVGVIWFRHITGYELVKAMTACVYPYIPLDLAKIAISAIVAYTMHNRVTGKMIN